MPRALSVLSLFLVLSAWTVSARASSWAEKLNSDYETQLKRIETSSLSSEHFIRKSFPEGEYEFYSEIAPQSSTLHGGFIVVNSADELVSSGQFQQGMFHGPLQIFEGEGARVILNYQFGRLLGSKSIDSQGQESSRDFNLPPQPQAVDVIATDLEDSANQRAVDPKLLSKIAKASFNKSYSKNVSSILQVIRSRMSPEDAQPIAKPSAPTKPSSSTRFLAHDEPKEPEVEKILSDREFMEEVAESVPIFSLSQKIENSEGGYTKDSHPDLNLEDRIDQGDNLWLRAAGGELN